MAKTIISSAIEIWKAIAKKKEPVVQDGKPLVTSAEVSSGKVKDTSKVNVVSSSASVKSISDKYSGNVQEEVKKISSGKSSSGGAVTQADYVIQGTPKPDLEYQAQAVKTTAQQQDLQIRLEQLKEEQRRIEQAKILTAQTAVFSASDYFSAENIKKREIAKVEEQLKSVRGVSQEEIDRAVKSGKVTSREGLLATAYTGTKGIEERYKQDAKNYEQILLEESKQNLEKEREQLLRVYDNEFQRIQEKVNQGYNIKLAEKEWDKITKDLEKIDKGLTEKENKRIQEKYSEWNKEWVATSGAERGDLLKRKLAWKRLEYQRDDLKNIKEQGKAFLNSVKTGAIVGAGTVGAVKGLGLFNFAKPVVSGITKVASKVGGMGLIAFQVGASTITAVARRGYLEKQYLNQGFSKEEARDLAKVESNIGFLKSNVEGAGFLAGALAGGGLINYASNIGRISAKEEQLVRQLMEKNPDAVRMQSTYGKITEQQIKIIQTQNPNAEIKIIQNGAEVLKPISEVQRGSIIRYRELGIDKTGLSQAEISALEKVVKQIKAKELVTANIVDGKITQLSVGEMESPLFSRARVSMTRAQIDTQGNYKGGKILEVYDTTPKSLFEKVAPKVIKNYPKNDQIESRSLFEVRGTGNVEYSEGLFKYHFEKGVGVETRLRKDVYKDGLWTESKINKPITATKSKYFSEQRLLKLDAVEEGDLIALRKTSQFRDLLGRDSSKRLIKVNAEIGKKLPKRATSLFDEPTLNEPSTKTKDVSVKNERLFGDNVGEETPLGYGIPRSTGGTGVVGLSERGDLFLSRTSRTMEIPESSFFDIRDVVAGSAGKITKTGNGLITLSPLESEKRTGFMFQSMVETKQSKIPDVQTRAINRMGLMPLSVQRTGARESFMSIQPVATQQVQQQQITQQPLMKLRTFTPFKPINPNLRIETPIIPFGFAGKVEVGGGQRREERRISIFGKTKYTPSLGSVLAKEKKEKITQKEYEKRSKKKYTGLERRPLFEIVDK